MNGMEMMLKTFGIDPEAIKAQATGAIEVVKQVDERMSRIELKLDMVITGMQNARILPLTVEVDAHRPAELVPVPDTQ